MRTTNDKLPYSLKRTNHPCQSKLLKDSTPIIHLLPIENETKQTRNRSEFINIDNARALHLRENKGRGSPRKSLGQTGKLDISIFGWRYTEIKELLSPFGSSHQKDLTYIPRNLGLMWTGVPACKKQEVRWRDFPGGTVDKNLPANAGGYGFDPWSRKIPHASVQLSQKATTTEPMSSNYWRLCVQSLCSAKEKPQQWEVRSLRWRTVSAHHS